MYEAKLKNRINHHESDWCEDQSQSVAKQKARDNYIWKYPDDNLNDTEYIVQPAARGLIDVSYPVVTLDEMVSTFRNSHRTNFRSKTLLAADDSSDDLFSMVQASKKAPGSTSIAVVDTKGPSTSNGKPTQDALAIYNDILTLSSLANVVAMKQVYNAHPEKYNITDPKEATSFIQAQVVNLNDTFTRRLGAYAIPGQTTAQHFNKEVLTANLHLEFLSALFSSFSFPTSAITKLDGILTQVKDSLANLKVGVESENQTLDHMIFTNYIEPVDIEGISEKILTGKIRMFYLKINQASWKATIGKSSVSKVSFTMDYFDTIFDINSNLVRSDISAITELIKKYTGKSFDEMSKLASPTTVQK